MTKDEIVEELQKLAVLIDPHRGVGSDKALPAYALERLLDLKAAWEKLNTN